ncbi:MULTISPECIES: hypothetical protein [unclassified Bradyrhizobium]|uniref:hypothetical protein n=1 Tax=unclassified Bradyrhizobium TaxID=2631580 RepID=UPI00339AB91C
MTPVAILLFLTGAVLAWRFRVWILVPFCLIAIVATLSLQLAQDQGFATAVGHALLAGCAPQFGYAFGLLARGTLMARYSPRQTVSRKASVAALYRQTSAHDDRDI